MVAIVINGSIRILNSLPATWNKQHNYPKMDSSIHYVDGFRDVIQPSYNTETQKLGVIYFDAEADVFTYPVVDKTPEEISAFQQQQLDNDTAQQKVLQRKVDGELGFDRIFAIVERKYSAGQITGPEAKAAVSILYPLVEPLYKGMWIEVQTRLNNYEANNVVPVKLVTLINDIQAVVNDYVSNTY